MEVKCANCDRYYPLDDVKQAGNGYYCKACHKHLKNRQCVPITTNMEVRCKGCDKIIGPDEAKVKDGNHVYCLRCYGLSQMPPRAEEPLDIVDDLLGRLHLTPAHNAKTPPKKMTTDPRCECATCGKVLSRHYDNPVQDGGKFYCNACYEKAGNQPLHDLVEAKGYRRSPARDADKLIECLNCGMVMTLDQLKQERDGKTHCVKCKKILPLRFRGTWEVKNSGSLKSDDLADRKGDYSAIAQLFKCLGDPCRVKIIELLSDHELCVFEFVEMTGFQYSAISYHLKMLKDLGMIKAYERGNFMVYSLTEKGETVHEFITKSKDLS